MRPQNASQLNLICSFERLPAYDSKTQLVIGFNLSVAVDAWPIPSYLTIPENPVIHLDLLRPWQWSTFAKVRVIALDAAGKPVMNGQTPLVLDGTFLTIPTMSFGMTDVELKTYRETLVSRLLAGWQRAEKGEGGINFILANATANKVVEIDVGDGNQPQTSPYPWHALVKQLSKYPAPIPQLLNLSAICTVPKAGIPKPLAASVASFAAAPVLPASGSLFRDELTPTYLGCQTGGECTFTYAPDLGSSYKLDNDMVVVATTVSFREPAASCVGQTCINLAKLWSIRTSTAPTDAFPEEDWRARLEDRLALHADPATIVLDAARKAVSTDVKLATAATLAATVRIVVAGLRDRIGLGYRSLDGARSLLERVAARVEGFESPFVVAPAEARETVRKAEQSMFATGDGFKNWWRVLEEATGEVRPGDIFKLLIAPADSLQGSPGEHLTQAVCQQLAALRSVVLRPEVLETVYRNQLRLVGKAIPNEKIKKSLLAIAGNTTSFSDLDLPGELALDAFWPVWQQARANQGSESTRSFLKCKIADLLVGMLRYRFGIASGAPPELNLSSLEGYYPSVAGQSELDERIVKYAKEDLALRLATLLVGEQSGTNATPTPTAHPIVFDIADLGSIGTADDPLEWINGAGVLMRRIGGPWQCLNLAKLNPYGDGSNAKPTTFVPSRLGYSNDVGQSLVSYDGHPLVARSPASDISTQQLVAIETGLDAFVRYDIDPTVSIPDLRFGEKYEIAGFVSSNSGALPKELSRKDGSIGIPFEFDVAALSNLQPPPNAIRRHDYLRRTPVGEVRLYGAPTGDQALSIPPVVEGVAPRARDVKWEALPGVGTESSRLPLVLLGPDTGYRFWVQKPSTDWKTWDRWVSGSETEETRSQVLGSIAYLSDLAGSGARPSRTSDDLSLADPAVEDSFILRVQRLSDTGLLEDVGSAPLSFPPSSPAPQPPAGDDEARARAILSRFRGGRAEVTLRRVTEPASSLFDLVDGNVYLLTLSVFVSQASLNRFAVRPPAPARSGAVLVSESRLVVETSTARLLDSDDEELDRKLALWKRLATAIPEQDSTRLDVELSGTFKYVQSVELSRQSWFWRGRETAPHPDVEGMPAGDSAWPVSAADWEVWEYGDRAEDDYLNSMMHSTTDAQGRRRFATSETLAPYGSGSGAALRAQHHRFRVRATGRYAPLYASEEVRPVESSASPDSIWKSVLVPGRRSDGGTPPQLRLLLPLTEGESTAISGGLLAVFDEPWHETGGFAEGLEAEIVTVEDPTAPDGLATQFWELGPDPIKQAGEHGGLSRPATGVGCEPSKDCVSISAIRGPIGHTFDDGDAARFLATSFVIPAPTVKRDGAAVDDLRWWMAKLRFRRRVTVGRVASAGPAPTESRRYSSWTEPMWAQFLPSFSVLSRSVRAETLLVHSTGRGFVFVDRDTFVSTGSIRQVAVEPDVATMRRFAVLTQFVSNISGQMDQEAYLGTWPLSGTWPDGETAKIDVSVLGRLRVRLLDVEMAQGSTTIADEKSLWTRIFGPEKSSNEDRDGDRAHPLAVSVPIESTGSIKASNPS